MTPEGGSAAEEGGSGPPLVVDLEEALVGSDLVWEELVRVVFERPAGLLEVLFGLLGGRARFRRRLTRAAGLDLTRVPLDGEVVRLIEEAKRTGRTVLLASETRRPGVEELAADLGAEVLLVATDATGPSRQGKEKLDAVLEQLETFDYVGSTGTDSRLFHAARRSYRMESRPRTAERAQGEIRESTGRSGTPAGERMSALFRALRPHQWVKNGLLLLPILAAHLRWDGPLVADVATGLVSFSLLASGLYLANDLADLPHDREHPSKQHRPLASGELSIPSGVAAMVGAIGTSVLLASRLPTGFAVALAVYFVLSAAYTWGLKRVLVLDVIILAALYTVRVVAGAALAEIELTSWFLAFSIFLFLSLALLKRVVELRNTSDYLSTGRSYRDEDLPLLQVVGPASGLMSALVYCLYITGPVQELYSHPDVLWLGLPLLLFWIVRVWLLALRGDVEEDPVVFVVRDPASYLTLAAFLGTVLLAS